MWAKTMSDDPNPNYTPIRREAEPILDLSGATEPANDAATYSTVRRAAEPALDLSVSTSAVQNATPEKSSPAPPLS
jgi:hypothetical protein